MITFQVSMPDGDGLTVRLGEVMAGEVERGLEMEMDLLEGLCRLRGAVMKVAAAGEW